MKFLRTALICLLAFTYAGVGVANAAAMDCCLKMEMSGTAQDMPCHGDKASGNAAKHDSLLCDCGDCGQAVAVLQQFSAIKSASPSSRHDDRVQSLISALTPIFIPPRIIS